QVGIGGDQVGGVAIAEGRAFSEPIGDGADDQEGELPLAARVLPAQRSDEFDVEVVDVASGKSLHGGPGDRFITAKLFGSGQALAVATAATASVVFFPGGGQGVQTRILADTAEQGGARGQIPQHGAVGEGGVGAGQQRATGTAGKLIDALSQMKEAFGAAAAD